MLVMSLSAAQAQLPGLPETMGTFDMAEARCDCEDVGAQVPALLTDLPEALPALRRNVELNAAHTPPVAVARLDWRDAANQFPPLDACNEQQADSQARPARADAGAGGLPAHNGADLALEGGGEGAGDAAMRAWRRARGRAVVLAADCVWLRELVEPFVAALAHVCAAVHNEAAAASASAAAAADADVTTARLTSRQGGAAPLTLSDGPRHRASLAHAEECTPLVLMAYKSRARSVDALLTAALERHGFAVHELPVLPGETRGSVVIWQLTHQSSPA